MRTTFITDKIEIDEIINQCDICFLGLVEEDGSPYVIPMNFGYAGEDLILHSGPHGKHLDLIAKDNRVCITFCTERKLMYQHPEVACSYSMTSKSVVCKGTVSFIEELDEKEVALKQFMQNYTDRPFKFSAPALKNVKVWRVKITEMTAKSFGQGFRGA